MIVPAWLTTEGMGQEQLAAAAARSTQAKTALQPAASSGSAGHAKQGTAAGMLGKSLVLGNGYPMSDKVKVSRLPLTGPAICPTLPS